MRPMSHSDEIPAPVFKQLPFLEGLIDFEERNDINDFEIHEDSVHRGFDQQELNDLACNLGLSKKASAILESTLN